MGCQKEIASLIRKKGSDYVLALKENQGTLYEDVKLYLSRLDNNPQRFAHAVRGHWGIENGLHLIGFPLPMLSFLIK